LVRVAINVEQLLFRTPGGTGRYTANLVRLLPELFDGDEVLAFCAHHLTNEIDEAYRSFGLGDPRGKHPDVSRLPRPLLYEVWHRLGRCQPRRMSPSIARAEIVHAPSPAVPPRGSVPLVVTVHDASFIRYPETFPPRGRRFHERGVALAARRADLVMTPSQAAADEIAELTPIPAEKIRVVHNGVDHQIADVDEVQRTLEHFGLTETPYVLWVGSVEPRKGLGTLIEAFDRLDLGKDRKAPHLVLVGPEGWLGGGHIDEGARRRLAGRLHVLGRLGDAALRSLYAGAELFAFPSLHEGFGLPLLEAMVQGTAVICSDDPALREVSGGAARLVAPRDIDAWSDALGELLVDVEARTALATAGSVRAESFSWESCVRATRAVYAEALGLDPPAAIASR
jgi:glycosyltransferase involved in cell wall biosynthesis